MSHYLNFQSKYENSVCIVNFFKYLNFSAKHGYFNIFLSEILARKLKHCILLRFTVAFQVWLSCLELFDICEIDFTGVIAIRVFLGKVSRSTLTFLITSEEEVEGSSNTYRGNTVCRIHANIRQPVVVVLLMCLFHAMDCQTINFLQVKTKENGRAKTWQKKQSQSW